MIALKDFRYGDRETGRSVEVRAGQEISGELLAAHKCDVAKLERTKFVARGEASVEASVKPTIKRKRRMT